MRICFVSFEYPPNIWGGEGTYADNMVNGLKRRGVDISVITRGEPNGCDEQTFRIPIPDVLYWRRLFFMKSALNLLHKSNKLLKFDLVHFNAPHMIFRNPNIPTVCTVHSCQFSEILLKLPNLKDLKTKDIVDLVLKSPLGSLCDFFTTREADRIICPSISLAQLIKSYYFTDEQKIVVIPNGIDLKSFDEIKDYDASVLDKYGLERDNYVLFVGRLSFLKGVQYLIAAFRSIKKEHPNLKLAIVGSGDFEDYLRNLAQGTEGVVFTGHVDSLKVKKILYQNSLVVVLPSLHETLPMVVLEAMACSKAVIATNLGGIPTLIKHGKNGFLAKPRDSNDLEGFIRILYNDENLRKSMSSFGRSLAEKEFTIDKMVDKTLKVYESLC